MGQYFICHSSTDGREAMALAIALEARGKDCWIAPRNIGAGTNYPHEIVEGIKKCPEFIVVLSDAAVRSDHILRELEMAVNQRKKIIPLRLTDVTLSNGVSYLLASVQWIEVTEDEWKDLPGRVADQIIGGSGSRLDYGPPGKSKGVLWLAAAVAGLLLVAGAGVAWKAGWLGQQRDAATGSAEPKVTEENEPRAIVIKPKPFQAAETAGQEGKEPVPRLSTQGEMKVEPDSVGHAVPSRPPVIMAEADPVLPVGEWKCEGKAAYLIEWKMTFSGEGKNLRASGPKAFVDGKPATKGERGTVLELDGQLDGTLWVGRYKEISKKTTEGDFKIEFKEDMQSFTGKIITPDGKASSRFDGSKR